ncbi:phage holin family protein [Labrys monachus]|uniref:Phage holin family protein n=1 Tax=Labrys monachus TaxID=217067 RepID=A0ABU0F6S7_9HYPH|nr:phage holin family protein [Labrys monachus]MDQ0390323.1 hypothetical protein [Labrys monachus]
MPDQANRPFLSLVDMAGIELRSQLGQEAQLLQAEMKAKVSVIQSTALYGGVAVFCMALGAIAGTATLVLFLVWLGLAPVLATLVVSVALLLAGAMFLWRARALMRDWTLLPVRTIAAVRADVATLKEAVSHVAS